ncbi:hypothetical protein FH972_022055 [Carpinus fangiana]|uniref:Uncharacterized protein n=1 Tax=Carpinus fangiana TaxID=176857 RepID=A0A5N6KRP3_9ROSI|nr:hypothetical protein FH972_022055 [Carpinus fangiana]
MEMSDVVVSISSSASGSNTKMIATTNRGAMRRCLGNNGPHTRHARAQAASPEPLLTHREHTMLLLAAEHRRGRDVPADEQPGGDGQVHHHPGEARPHRAPDGMHGAERAVVVRVHAVEAEGDDERPHGAQRAQVDADGRRRAHDDGVRELAQHDDGEGRVAVVLVLDVDGRAEVELKQPRDPRPKGEDVAELLPHDGDGRDGDLGAQADALEEERDPETQPDGGEDEVEAILRAVVV